MDMFSSWKVFEISNKLFQIIQINILGGLIDRGHHETLARRALDETIGLHEVVEHVRSKVSEEDTLIVVTADHSHTFTVGGYSVSRIFIIFF